MDVNWSDGTLSGCQLITFNHHFTPWPTQLTCGLKSIVMGGRSTGEALPILYGYMFWYQLQESITFLCLPSDLISHQVVQSDKCKMNETLIAAMKSNSLLAWL